MSTLLRNECLCTTALTGKLLHTFLPLCCWHSVDRLPGAHVGKRLLLLMLDNPDAQRLALEPITALNPGMKTVWIAYNGYH